MSRAVRALLLVLSLFAGAAGYVGCAPRRRRRWHRLHTVSRPTTIDFSRTSPGARSRSSGNRRIPGPGSSAIARRTEGGPANDASANIGSIASVGFGLSGMCIAAERGWYPRRGGSHRTHRDDAAVVRGRDAAGARLVLSFRRSREPAHARGRASCRRSTRRCCCRVSSRSAAALVTTPTSSATPTPSTGASTSSGCWLAARRCRARLEARVGVSGWALESLL